MDFPWEDILACRYSKKAKRSGFTDEEVYRGFLEKGDSISCPNCGNGLDDLEAFYFNSPKETWEHLCGRAGWIVVCIDCQKQVRFDCEMMS